MTNHIWLLFPILSFILHFSPKNGSYVYQTYRLSEEMLFFETLHDFYRTAIIYNKVVRLSESVNVDRNYLTAIFFPFMM
jgi:hypothetical protein